jgi:RND family efflux transporter MFP subunit
MSAPSAKSRFLLQAVLVLALLAAAIVLVQYLLRPTARVVAITRGHAEDARPGSVTVVAQHELDLKTEVNGRVVRSDLDEGKRFALGAFMAQLDTGDIDLTIERAENEYQTLKNRIAVGSQVKLQLEGAKADLENQERLFKMGQVAQSDLDNKRRGVEAIEQQMAIENVTNQSQLQVDEINIKDYKRQRDKMTVRAPFDGVVSRVDAVPGALIPGGTGVAHFIMTARTVQARISEENFGGIVVGDPATVIFLSFGSAKSFKAKVSKVLPTAEADTQRYVVYLDVDIPVEQLKPGMTGEVSILVSSDPWALLAPRRAYGSNKLLVVNDGRVEVRTVKVGFIGLNKIQILEGVKEGDLVIADDLDQFHPGDRVRTELLPN